MDETICNVCSKDFKTKTKLTRHQSCKYKCKILVKQNDIIIRNDVYNKEDIIKLFNEFDKKDITKDEVIELLQSYYKNKKDDNKQNDISQDKSEVDKEVQDADYICNDCKKIFAQRQGLYKHNKLKRCKVKHIININNGIQNNNVVVNNNTNITNITNNSNDIYNINIEPKFIINVNPLGLETYTHISIKDFKKIFKKVDTLMDNLCYTFYNNL